jgi:hypothetical protein
MVGTYKQQVMAALPRTIYARCIMVRRALQKLVRLIIWLLQYGFADLR